MRIFALKEPNNMKIYHYTSIQTLALILKYKNIRFNRLDMVDDMEESIYGSGPTQTKLGMYTFVSCWTKSEKENLALWNMYTNYKGVRIGIDAMPFTTYGKDNNFKSLFPNTIKLESDYIIISWGNEAKLHDVIYIDTPEKEIKNIINPTNDGGILMQIHSAGIYKRKEWAMQQESRFKIFVLPANCVNSIKSSNNVNSAISNIFSSIITSLIKNEPIATNYIDIALDPAKLSDIEIMMGPMTSDADRIIVESLLNPYPKAKIKNSLFLGKLRKKR